MGDVSKNISVLWLCDKEELKKEKIDEIAGIIKLKKLYTNTLDTQVIGLYSLRMNPVIDGLNNHYARLNDLDKNKLNIITASEEGYLRLF